MKKIMFLFALLMPFMMMAQVEQIAAEKALVLLEEDAILVDVREADEVAELAYDSEGMLQIPFSELANRYGELPKDKTLIIACRSGNLSQEAIAQLAELGITNTVNLEGGIIVWQGKGFPVIVDGIAPVSKACCSKGSSDGKAGCSGKSGETGSETKACCSGKSAEKSSGSEGGRKCCSGKKS